MYMATKLGRVRIYNKELLSIKLHNPLNTWSREVMWQIKNISTAMQIAGHCFEVVTWL